MDYSIINEIIKTFLWFFIPIVIVTGLLILMRVFAKMPDYVCRKILHLIAISTMIPLIVVPVHWWVSEIIMGISTIGIIVLLIIFERTNIYKKFFIEKGEHEIIISFLIFVFVVTSLIAFFWGYRGDSQKYLLLIALFSWGLGDAMASIFGHLIGKHPISGKLIEGTKSIEGSIACFAFAFLISFILLFVLMTYTLWLSLIESLIIGVLVSLAELFTKKGLDNLTCPLVAALILFLFSLF